MPAAAPSFSWFEVRRELFDKIVSSEYHVAAGAADRHIPAQTPPRVTDEQTCCLGPGGGGIFIHPELGSTVCSDLLLSVRDRPFGTSSCQKRIQIWNSTVHKLQERTTDDFGTPHHLLNWKPHWSINLSRPGSHPLGTPSARHWKRYLEVHLPLTGSQIGKPISLEPEQCLELHTLYPEVEVVWNLVFWNWNPLL